MQITIAAKRRDDEWRGVHIVNDEFEDALINSSVADMIMDTLAPTLVQELPTGTEISMKVTITKPGEKRNNARPTAG